LHATTLTQSNYSPKVSTPNVNLCQLPAKATSHSRKVFVIDATETAITALDLDLTAIQATNQFSQKVMQILDFLHQYQLI
jgi:hypothetical protein